MATVSESELVSIKSLQVEPDRTDPARYWIWMKIDSKVRTVASLEACVVEGICAYPELKQENAISRKRCLFMGRHGLEIGENELPALPLSFDREIAGRNVVVRFALKSKRDPDIAHRKFQIVGPGLFTISDVKKRSKNLGKSLGEGHF